MPAVIAHRGASAHAPEHTFAAYDLALEMGADLLEVDVRPCGDGTLVAVHDPTLERTTGDPRELAQIDVGVLEEIDPAVRPPAIDAVFARYGRRTHYWIDFKDPAPADEHALLALVDRHGLRGHVRVQSFERACIDRMSTLDPLLPLAQLYRRDAPQDAVHADLDRVGARGVAIGRAWDLVDAQLVEAARERGLAVHAYTVNDEGAMERMTALGVAALITDVPERARLFVDGLVSSPR